LSTLTLDICVSEFLDPHSTVGIIILESYYNFFVYCTIFSLMVNTVHVVLLDVSPVITLKRQEKTSQLYSNFFKMKNLFKNELKPYQEKIRFPQKLVKFVQSIFILII